MASPDLDQVRELARQQVAADAAAGLIPPLSPAAVRRLTVAFGDRSPWRSRPSGQPERAA